MLFRRPLQTSAVLTRSQLRRTQTQQRSLRRLGALALAVIVLSVALVGCAPAAPTATPVPPPAPTQAPAQPPTAAPAPTQAPAQAPTAAPAPTQAPPTATQAPTQAPTQPPTAAPTATQPPPTATATAAPAAVTVSFAKDILPVMERRCVKCHGGQRTEDGLSLKSYADLMKGSKNGPVIKPGDAANSELIKEIVSGSMPKREPALLPAEIRAFQAWVDAGAPNN